jgi:hypothetical protein
MLFLGTTLCTTHFTFAKRQEDTFYFVNVLIFRHRVNVSAITHIRYIPTWRFQDKLRSLYIHYKGGWAPYTELNNSQYPERTLANIVYDIVHLNPRIELDEHTKSLMKRYRSEALVK